MLEPEREELRWRGPVEVSRMGAGWGASRVGAGCGSEAVSHHKFPNQGYAWPSLSFPVSVSHQLF